MGGVVLLFLILLLWCQFLYISIFNSIVAFELVVDAQVCVCVHAHVQGVRVPFFPFWGARVRNACKCVSERERERVCMCLCICKNRPQIKSHPAANHDFTELHASPVLASG